MANQKRKKGASTPPIPGWAIYLRTSSEDHQKPELSQARASVPSLKAMYWRIQSCPSSTSMLMY